MTSTTTTTVSLFDFDDTYARDLPELAIAWRPAEVPHPELVVVNTTLADALGLDPAGLDTPYGAAVLAGDVVAEGSNPVALAYAGHQFGGFSPVLGDGRAVLLGEVLDPAGCRFDVHLKGSGRTPFARGGDGKATLGPMLREFMIAEAMAALGIPTTRAFAVATTGESVQRERLEPGAVLSRVAASHLRIGTFEYAPVAVIPMWCIDWPTNAIARHHPQAAAADNRYLALLDAVIDAQAALVARWMLVGFIHGVMNTDNVTISGEGIDYGPCAFMDRYDPATVFSSIDRNGRYAYRNQPPAQRWNLARFAETLLSLIDPDHNHAVAAATARLETFEKRYEVNWQAGMAAKLGVDSSPDGPSTDEEALIARYLDLLFEHEVDYTSSFRALAAALRGPVSPSRRCSVAPKGSPPGNGSGEVASAATTFGRSPPTWTHANPIFIPRNHLVENAIGAAKDGDMHPFRQLLEVVTRPFDERPELDRYREPAPVGFDDTYQTFCGT